MSLGPVAEPAQHDIAAARRVHREDYTAFLPKVWDLWTADGRNATALRQR